MDTYPSICIPRAKMVQSCEVKTILEKLFGKATIDRVDVVPCKDVPEYCKIFIHMKYWPEDNNITKACIPITGKFNIGKWFRNSDYAFYLKKDYDTFTVEQGEIYSYIRFHTEESILFKQFRYSPKFDLYQKDCYSLTKLGLKQFNKYYSTFKIKGLVLQDIKENLL